MRSSLAVCVLLAVVMPIRAEAPPIAYEKEIAPILVSKCLACHSGPVRKGGLDLASHDGLLKGGKRGPAVVAGKASDSLLMRLISKADKPSMPPKGEEPLTEREVNLLKQWIDQGAPRPSRWPATVVVRAPAPSVKLVRAVALSRDGGIVAAARANQVHVFDVKSGDCVRTLTDPSLKPRTAAHLAMVESLALSPDGRLLATGSFQELALWDLETGALRRKLTGFSDRVVALSFSPDGKLLASGGGAPTVEGEIKIIELASGKVIADIARCHSDTVCGVAFSPDGGKLASAGA